MKRLFLSLLAVVVWTIQSASAMSYERASEEARFLTDKMAYELNLDDYQYQQAYDINFNYFYNLNDASDFYGRTWRSRNSALELLLSALQFRNYCRLDYFYRPVYIYRNAWTFPIYRRYPRTRFFRPAPPRPPRPRPGNGFHFESVGRPQPPRPNNYDRPGFSIGKRPENRPSDSYRPDRRPEFNSPNKRPNRPDTGNRPTYRPDRNRPNLAPRNNRNNFQPSDQNSFQERDKAPLKRIVNNTPNRRGNRM